MKQTCKYITKQHSDERFFGKKRYYVSANIIRPEVNRWTVNAAECNMFDIDREKWTLEYFSPQMQYGIFSNVRYGVKKKRLLGYFDFILPVYRKFSLKGGIKRTMRKSLLKIFLLRSV